MRTSVLRASPRLSLSLTLAATCLAGCGGDKSSGGAVQAAAASPAPASAPAAAPAAATAAPDGRALYQRCAVCHQATGQGVPGAFPPVALSEWATAANAALPIRVVLHGLQGPVTVKGQKFNGTMPAFGTGQPMNDADVAAVLTYVRSSWGNKASAVTADDVAKERAATASHTAQFTAVELAPLLGAGTH
jgi:mono/diheme cytochrome c family protein